MAEMATLTSRVPAPLLEYGLDQAEIDDSVTQALAMKLFATGRITSGVAARLLGMNRLAFLDMLHWQGVPYFDLTREELEQEQVALDRVLS